MQKCKHTQMYAHTHKHAYAHTHTHVQHRFLCICSISVAEFYPQSLTMEKEAVFLQHDGTLMTVRTNTIFLPLQVKIDVSFGDAKAIKKNKLLRCCRWIDDRKKLWGQTQVKEKEQSAQPSPKLSTLPKYPKDQNGEESGFPSTIPM